MKCFVTRRSSGVRGAVAALCFLLVCASAAAQPQPPGKTADERVIEAHRGVASGVVEATYKLYYARPDETEFVASSYRIVFDRPTNRIRIERPGYTLISDGTDIYLVAEALPGRHLRVPLAGDLTYERLVEVFPDLADPTPPVLVYLFSENPIAWFAIDGQGGPSPLPPTEDQIHLSYPLGQDSHTHSFARSTRLIEEMLIDLDVGQPDLVAVRFYYAFEWSGVGEAIDDAEFDLDLKRSHEMTTLSAFLSPPGAGGGGQGGPGGQGGGAGGDSLVGMPLPEIELSVLGSDEKVMLSDLDRGVVVFECFASWSKASVLDLPALATFDDWCKEEGHDVTIYALAVGEQPATMTKWLAALEKTANRTIEIPVLMDPTTDAAIALRLPTVPRTLIVVDGRVVDVFGGVKPTYLDDLKKGLPGWLEKVKEVEED